MNMCVCVFTLFWTCGSFIKDQVGLFMTAETLHSKHLPLTHTNRHTSNKWVRSSSSVVLFFLPVNPGSTFIFSDGELLRIELNPNLFLNVSFPELPLTALMRHLMTAIAVITHTKRETWKELIHQWKLVGPKGHRLKLVNSGKLF